MSDVDGPPLLAMGRRAIQALNLVKIYAIGDGPSIERECILQEYADLFKEKLGVGASWVSPIHFEYKGNGERRICVDLRKANEAVIRERFPIPRIQDLLRQLSGAKMFSTLDLRKAYWQLRLLEGSRDITSFKPAGKVYQFKRLPFGLASAAEA